MSQVATIRPGVLLYLSAALAVPCGERAGGQAWWSYRPRDTRSMSTKAAQPAGCGTVIGLAVVLFLEVKACGGGSGSSSKDYAETAEEHLKGFHCLSAWDGSAPKSLRFVVEHGLCSLRRLLRAIAARLHRQGGRVPSMWAPFPHEHCNHRSRQKRQCGDRCDRR